MKISELGLQDTLSCVGDATLAQAGALLLEKGLDSLPVIDGRGRVIGVLTADRIASALAQFAGAGTELPVSAAMDQDLVTCHPEEDVRDVLPLLALLGTSRLPVVDERRRLLAVLSLEDLLCLVLAGEPGSDFPTADVLDTFSLVVGRPFAGHWTRVPVRRTFPFPKGKAPAVRNDHVA